MLKVMNREKPWNATELAKSAKTKQVWAALSSTGTSRDSESDSDGETVSEMDSRSARLVWADGQRGTSSIVQC